MAETKSIHEQLKEIGDIIDYGGVNHSSLFAKYIFALGAAPVR